jgi:hypothetical protein
MKKNIGLLLMGLFISGWGLVSGAAATTDPRHSPPGFSHQTGHNHPGSFWVGGTIPRGQYHPPYYHSYRPRLYAYRVRHPFPYPGIGYHPYRASYHPPYPRYGRHTPPGYWPHAHPSPYRY